jgi:hypothetical protein
MYQITVRESEFPWAGLGMPGVSMKGLHKDEATGAMTLLTRIEAGASIPAHWHSKADETVFVLNGDFVETGDRPGLHCPDPLQRRTRLPGRPRTSRSVSDGGTFDGGRRPRNEKRRRLISRTSCRPSGRLSHSPPESPSSRHPLEQSTATEE